MKKSKIGVTAFIGCKWIDLQRCKWYEFSKKRRIKQMMFDLCNQNKIKL